MTRNVDGRDVPLPERYSGSLVLRKRLLEPLSAVDPRCVLIAAPAGYGKSVLAAQLTESSRTAVWVECGEDGESRESLFARIRAVVSEPPATLGHRPEQDSLFDPDAATAALQEAFTDEGWLVLDGLSAAGGCDLLALVRSVQDSTPCRVRIVATMREADSVTLSVPWAYVIDSHHLAFDDDEVLELVAGEVGRPDVALAAQVLRDSGGHPALASLLARQAALSGRALVSVPHGVHAMLWSLACQVDSDAVSALRVAAVLGSGDGRRLDEALGRPAFQDMARCASVLSLLRVSGTDAAWSYRLHDLVRSAFAPPEYIAQMSPAQLRRTVNALAETGDAAAALRIATEAHADGLILEVLESEGDELLRRGEARVVARAIGCLGPGSLVTSPRVLLLKASVALESPDACDGRNAAQAALDLARHSGDSELEADSLLLLAKMSFSLGDQRTCGDYIRSLLENSRMGHDPSRSALALAFSSQACACLLDSPGLAALQGPVESALGHPSLPVDTREQLRLRYALSRALLWGEWDCAARTTDCVRRAPGVSPALRILAEVDFAAASAELGRCETALAVTRAVMEEADRLGFRSTYYCAMGTLSSLEAASGSGTDWSGMADAAVSGGYEIGEVGSSVMNAIYTSATARACRDADAGLGWAERAMAMLEGHCLPVLELSAQIERAASLLALGDRAVAGAAAIQLSERARGAGARYLGVKADLIVAAANCAQRGEFDGLMKHGDLIGSGSVNWMTAMYIRAFPELLASIVTVLEASEVPSHLLRLIPDPYATEALEACVGRLPRVDIDALSVRMLGHPFDRQVHASGGPVTQPAPACSVRLFGGFEVRTPSGPVPDKAWVKRKARLMFAMLAARPGKDVPREQIIEYLWPDMDEQRGLNNFYVAWSSMKRALSPGAGRDETCPYVEHVRGVCRLLTDAVTSDLIEFESSLTVARKARSAGDTDSELAALQAIADLYRGELLPGDSYDDWFASLRERCRHDFEDAMLRSAEILEARGELQAALGLLRRALTHDPWREDLYQSALRLQIAAGQRSAAIETYMLCRTRLVEDLGIDPSGETTRLYEHVLGMEI